MEYHLPAILLAKTMQPTRWREVSRIFAAAVQQPPRERASYIAAACGGDAELQRDVESLLAEERQDAPIDRRVADHPSIVGLVDPVGPGTHIGIFRVDTLLGAGGMGEVYRAHDTKLHRDVAIKILPPALATDADRLARFKRESQLLASLNHPNIAGIHGFEDAGGIHALVLELVEGPTLADRIAAGPLPLDEAVAIARQIADALEAAHEVGIVHRDLKPANIKVRDDGTVKVLDFGLAKMVEPVTSTPSVSQSPTITTPAMTAAGIILGTAAYMSPEQAKGKPADKRSDIWAFGCVLYEMLTGRRAFAGDDVAETLAEVIKGTPAWGALPSLPASTRLLLQRCLERDRNNRVGDVAAIRFVLTNAPLIAPPPVERPKRPWAYGAGALAIIAIAVLGSGWAWLNRARPAEMPGAVRLAFDRPARTVMTNTGRQTLTISPNGRRIVFVSSEQLFLRALESSEAIPIRGTENVNPTSPAVSPDGAWVAFAAARPGGFVVETIPLDGGVPFAVCTVAAASNFGLAWSSPDTILFATNDGVFRVPARGGTPVKVFAPADGEAIYGPQMIDDDHLLLTVTRATGNERWDKAQIIVQSISTGERRVVLDGGSDGRWLPTGHLLFAVETSVFAVAVDRAAWKSIGAPVPVLTSVRRSGPAGVNTAAAHFAVSENGTLAYIPAEATGQFVNALYDLSTGTSAPLTVPGGRYARISPDATQVVSEEQGGGALFVSPIDGRNAPRRLNARTSSPNFAAVWSPDGVRIAYRSVRSDSPGIYAIRADGMGDETLMVSAPGWPMRWAANDRLFYVADRKLWSWAPGESPRVIVAKLGPDIAVNVTDSVQVSISPDGLWAAYHAFPADRPTAVTYVQSTEKADISFEVAAAAHSPLWSPDGRQLYYVTQGINRLMVVDVQTKPSITFGSPRVVVPELFQISALPFRNYDVTLDGRRILMQLPDRSNARAQQVGVILNWFTELRRLMRTE